MNNMIARFFKKPLKHSTVIAIRRPVEKRNPSLIVAGEGMKKWLTITGALIITLLLQGCSDLMDIHPKTEIGGEQFFNSAEELQIYINSLINWPLGHNLAVQGSDDATSTGSVEYRNIMTNPLTSQQVTGGWDWGRLRNINYFLEHFDRADIPEADLNHFEGVARFHRARFYMGMVKRFGDVPWYDRVLETNDEDLYKPRDPREYVIDRIFEDYQFAADHVRPDAPAGAVDNWTVRTFMARHALHEGTFRNYHDYLGLPHQPFLEIARDQSEAIIESGRFAIHSTGDPDNDYGSLFISTDLVGNPEVILLNRSIDGERNSGYWGYHFGNYELSPTKDLLQTYLMDDGSFYSAQPGWQTRSFVEEFENRDPRLSQTYAYPGWVVEHTDTYIQGTSGQPYIQEINGFFTGYHMLKWFVNNSNSEHRASIDTPVLRYGEVLLIYAEAKAELGELTQADLDRSINLLRDRAGMPHMTVNPPTDPVLQAQYPGLPAQLLEIRRERRVELAFESRRYNDVMRYRAGHLLEQLPTGIYFSGLGNHDLTGDGHPDIKLIPHTESIPPQAERETNDLGQTLIYHRAGPFGTSGITVLLENGDHGNILARNDMGTFEDPKFYYRPVPYRDTQINPNLTQIFGWE